MNSLYNSLSKEELIERLLLAEKDRIYLLELLELKDKKLKEISTQIPQNPSEITNARIASEANNFSTFFDPEFSKDFYSIQNKGYGCKVNTLQSLPNTLPSMRSRELITGVKQFKLTISGIGYIGFGTKNMKNDEFPGYTPQGWMLNTDGNVYYNNSIIEQNNAIDFNYKTVSIKLDPANSQITVDGIAQKMGNNLPQELYFVVTIQFGQQQTFQIQP